MEKSLIKVIILQNWDQNLKEITLNSTIDIRIFGAKEKAFIKVTKKNFIIFHYMKKVKVDIISL